jgi:hypothetical protein
MSFISKRRDFFDANTVFFRQRKGGDKPAHSLAPPSCAHAETVFALAQRGVHGTLPLPKTEKAAQSFHAELTKRLSALTAIATDLSRSRTGDERKALELADLLEFWVIRGKPSRESRQ